MPQKITLLLALCLCLCCKPEENMDNVPPEKPEPEIPIEPEKPFEPIVIPDSAPDATSYKDLYDKVADQGQFYFPEITRFPKMYWNCVRALTQSEKNKLGETNLEKGLQYHLLCQSIAGLVNRAFAKGDIDIAVWMDVNKGGSYSKSKEYLGKEIGRQTGIELATKNYGNKDGIKINVRDLFEGYVLTDIEHNPESNVVATVAAHVYNSIIVDVRDQAYFESKGYKMTYDARKKTTADSWKEFRDKCSNKALVIMPVETGELREYAIANNLFCINLNKKRNQTDAGQNLELLEEVLQWLAPNSPVLGWESGGENVFVTRTSRYGHLMQPADWSYNHSLTSLQYNSRQKQTLAKVINPRDIHYDDAHHVSFYLTDGDNYQMMMGDAYYNDFFNQPSGEEVRMSYGTCSETLCQLAPAQFDHYYEQQKQAYSIMEAFGGGYIYADTYSNARNRTENLKIIAARTANHMRQHRIKILHLMMWDYDNDAAKEAYKAFIEANDQLEGIVTIQFNPYNAGKGNILWFPNEKGYDIPVVSTAYSLWHGSKSDGQGDPDVIARQLQSAAERNSKTFICVHKGSTFSGQRGADAAKMCMNQLPENFKAVNAQELIWQIRMKYRKEQTLKFLETIK